MATGATLVVGADVSAVKPALDSVGIAARQAGQDVENAFNGATTATKPAEAAQWGLFGALKEVRGEARAHSRVFNFYGAQIASLTGVT